MAKNTLPQVASRVTADGKNSDFRNYNDWFLASPNPWSEIAGIEHGADQSFASTIRSTILNSEAAERAGLETRLLHALARPGVTDAGVMFICRMLALIGTTNCVPALAPLLHDARTADAARYVLDAIADPAVDEAYRTALENLGGSCLAGLIGSIAQRRDTKAIAALTRIQQDLTESAEVHAAATRALDRLAGKP